MPGLTGKRADTKLTPADDRRHRLSDSPLARESLIFLLFLPEEHLGCIVYTWVNGESKAGSMALVFGEDNEQLFKFHTENVKVPRDFDFDEWRVGEVHLRHGAPHEEAFVSFHCRDQQGQEFGLDYEFRAMTPAFTYHDNSGGCPPFIADNRLEQSGRVRGVITVAGKRIPFDTTGHRDHSSGTRDWTAFHHYKWLNVQSPSGIAINLMDALALDTRYQFGYVDKGGIQSPVTSIVADVERDAEHYTYTSARFKVTDELGRETEISSGPRTSLAVWPAGGLESHDAAGPCTVDGVPALMHLEEGWEPEFVRRRKAMMSLQFDSKEAARVLTVNRSVGATESV
ncbi:DUF7064 domain-containing protein [Roseiarcus sp.]|uniref:DUF7064 domain-containing protein n=1 Tax=Roseiarcus sp. TaxID=1969460 RepID=UPI003F9795AF